MICSFKKCDLSGEERVIEECEFAIINDEGEPDCGYG